MFSDRLLPGAVESTGKEYKIKAAFMVNFAKLISWPEEAYLNGTEQFFICVVGRDYFGTAFAGVEARTIKGRSIQLQKYRDFTEVKRCHIMFVDSSIASELPQYLSEHPTTAVVTVGESNGFARDVGMIEFFKRSDDRLSFKINNQAAKKRNLYVEASLLDLAAEVY